ncbi:stress-activated map kinase interacting protein 1-domain-containing protein [Mycena rosella]|uniref:Stress-activated map kinase interacting protein 1-domain-containing protein n=1 Tax=Mycena rosella TaxID=1033263 RepID=A0AAD7DSL7_MYCRO|nr:stress-activated map kinase interacting protein 1-domain-containing protein [Mycena rosella]
MSLISDTDFLIHSLRLSYLRDVEDPYGARVINLAPAYNSNSYIIAASLNDIDRWPELAMPSSPQLSDDERPSGFPGARLKYTNTIMGGRTGGLGLRVNGKRASTSKRLSMSGTPQQGKDFLVQGGPSNAGPVSSSLAENKADTWVKVQADVDMTGSAPALEVKIQQPTVAEEAPVAKAVQFIPKFKGAAQMEARRRERMAARRGPGGAAPAPPPVLDFSSSSDEEEIMAGDSSDSDFGQPNAADAMDDGDEFDPDFAASRTPGLTSDSVSDVISVLSATTSSVPISSSQGGQSLTLGPRIRARLSPVSEGPTPDRSGPYFDMLTPAPSSKPDDASPQFPARKTEPAPRARPHAASHNGSGSGSVSSVAPEMNFARKKVAPLPSRPQRSALTVLIVSSGESTNPFAELYAAVSGRGEGASTNVSVYFPSARAPKGQAMDLNVRKDATVEEVIGFALWTYWEEGWLPKLDEGMENADEEKLAMRLSAVGWIMRIAEEDGEVDDDFPPPDRVGKVAKFNAEAYAVLEATPAQIQQNQLIESKIQRHPSRVTAAKKLEKKPSTLAFPVSSSALPGSGVFGSTPLGSVPFSNSFTPASGRGPQIFLRIKVEDTPDTVHIATTIPVSAGMYMQEVLEHVCRKTKLDFPENYALLLANDNTRILIPLDRTVASLQGKRELVLIRRTMIDDNVVRGTGKTTDPNASILKRMSDAPEVRSLSAIDYNNVYKQFTIYRKMPMLVAKQERTLAFDGLYIHILPTANKATKAVFDSGKHVSYHIRSIADCQQSTKSSAIFKLVLGRAGGKKRYDYEAESAKHASEIVAQIWTLKNSVDRSGTIKSSRRSRAVG